MTADFARCDRCGERKTTEWKRRAIVPTCQRCLEVAEYQLRPTFLSAYPEIVEYLAWSNRESDRDDEWSSRVYNFVPTSIRAEGHTRETFVHAPLDRFGSYKKIVVTAQGEHGRETKYLTMTNGRKEFNAKLAAIPGGPQDQAAAEAELRRRLDELLPEDRAEGAERL